MIAFAKARLDEDEAVAKAAQHEFRGVMSLAPSQFNVAAQVAVEDHMRRHDPARVLREVEAKRAILDHHKPVRHGGRTMCYSCLSALSYWPCPTVRHLIAVWSDHPDYQEGWKP
jgi:hypothetical protein